LVALVDIVADGFENNGFEVARDLPVGVAQRGGGAA
jgi:hypothetical protein